jgi:hypothetical protein
MQWTSTIAVKPVWVTGLRDLSFIQSAGFGMARYRIEVSLQSVHHSITDVAEEAAAVALMA